MMKPLRLPPRLAAVLLALAALLFLAGQLAAPVHALQHVRVGAPVAPDDSPGTHTCPDCVAFAAIAFAAPLAALPPLLAAAAAIAPRDIAAAVAPAARAFRARNRGPPSA